MKTIDLFTFKKMSAVLVDNTNPPKFTPKNSISVASELETVMDKGFHYDSSVLYHLLSLSPSEYKNTVKSYHECMNDLRGGDLQFKVLRKTFPTNPFSTVTTEEDFTQLIQYLFYGCDIGGYTNTRYNADIDVDKLQLIKGVSWEDVVNKFSAMLSSKDSISESDSQLLVSMLNEYVELRQYAMNVAIQHKEILGLVVSELFKHDDVDNKQLVCTHVKTITDVLRIAVTLSGGDTSLSEGIVFKKFKRSERKFLCNAIRHAHKIQSEFNFNEDLLRYSGLWKTLAKAIHVGDYGLHSVFDLLRNEPNSIPTFHRIVHNGELDDILKQMVKRPTEFTRSLTRLLQEHNGYSLEILNAYSVVASASSLNSLISALSHFRNIDRKRIIMPKGKYTQKIIKLPDSKLDANLAVTCSDIVHNAIVDHISAKDTMNGEYYIDPSLYFIKLPSQQRNASDGLLSVSRGSRMSLDTNDKYVRLFTHWIGDDIDLSFGLLDETLNGIDNVSFSKRTLSIKGKVAISHSGDFTYAPEPDGASEFIDINVDTFDDLVNQGYRYGMMYVNVYYGSTFDKMPHCVSGWTTRSKTDTALYVPSDVKNMIKIESKSRECVSLIIDFKFKEIIWADLALRSDGGYGNTVRNLMAGNIEALDFVVNNHRMSVGELIEMHVWNRGGKLVSSPTDNSINYGSEYGFDVNAINSSWL